MMGRQGGIKRRAPFCRTNQVSFLSSVLFILPTTYVVWLFPELEHQDSGLKEP